MILQIRIKSQVTWKGSIFTKQENGRINIITRVCLSVYNPATSFLDYSIFYFFLHTPVTKNSTDLNAHVILTLGIHAWINTINRQGFWPIPSILICSFVIWLSGVSLPSRDVISLFLLGSIPELPAAQVRLLSWFSWLPGPLVLWLLSV